VKLAVVPLTLGELERRQHADHPLPRNEVGIMLGLLEDSGASAELRADKSHL
jgi:hypothetical protein